jgi:hypothetical protein
MCEGDEGQRSVFCLRADCKDSARSRHHHVVGSSALRRSLTGKNGSGVDRVL